jgi:hypothetical protein
LLQPESKLETNIDMTHQTEAARERFGDKVIFTVAHAFLNPGERPSVASVAYLINRRMELSGSQRLNHKRVYECIHAALELGFAKFQPPVEKELSENIAQKLGFEADRIRVVNVLPENLDAISSTTAELIFEKILEGISQIGNFCLVLYRMVYSYHGWI